MERRRLKESISGGGSYFASPKTDIEFIPSGCKLLDLSLGGGWAENRIGNVVGDKSTGKTLICIEAAANFGQKYSDGVIMYRESEAAFDKDYAAALGMPVDRVDFGPNDQPLETVEDLFEDLEDLTANAKEPVLYICDSLDALSDRAELERDLSEGTYGMEKAKKMSQLFRRLTQQMSTSCVTLMVVSQVRSRIGAMFGRQWTRSGGRALDFYASQVLYLAQVSMIKKTVSNIKRTTGVNITAKVEKNKVALPYRDCDFSIKFGFGIDDVSACLQWLKQCKMLKELGINEKGIRNFIKSLERLSDEEYYKKIDEIHQLVENHWYEIEQSFLPQRRKYGTEE